MLSLNINKLRSEVEAREQRKTKIYDKILELCNNKILSSNQKNDDYSCTYIVPNVVFGLPLYDVNECVKYIMDKLVDKGFDIYFAFPTTIHISWKPVDKKNTYSNTYLNPQQYKRLEAPRQQNQQNQQIQKYNGHNNDYTNTTNTTSNDKQLTISNSYRKKIVNSNSNGQGQQHQYQNYQQHSQQQPQKQQYRPIDDYTQSNQTIYDLDDLDIFKNKLDNLFD